MDPFLLSQIVAAAQQQPDMLAKMLAMQGIEPPGMPNVGMGTAPGAPVFEAPPAAVPPIQPAAPLQAPAMATIGQPYGPPTVDPAAPATAPATAQPGTDMQKLQAMLGIAGKAGMQSADQKPIMSGGISSAQRVPEAGKITGGSSAASYDMIAKLLMGGGQNPLRVPQLGALMRG